MLRLIATVLLSAFPFAAHAFDMSHYENGGRFADFMAVIGQYNASGQRFPITGTCKSACTMFLSIRNVCVGPGARFYFHAGKARGGVDPRQTAVMLSSYNFALQSYIREHHM